MDMNVVCLVGRLTASPEMKVTPKGTSVCSFCLAVESRFKDESGKPIAKYIDCVAWKHNAEFLCKWFDKGVRVAITGELDSRLYEKDGKKHKVTEILVSTIGFADGKREPKSNAIDADGFTPVMNDDELPWT